ncbi:anchored repeat-type ABC transporter ATP-binding subunit [Allorhizocola rhizosphaerae]|uniref:anchored repeat-type ABC transporter ATP-binding subunit n=1 Tax=Allorhizocola rhizosphaerae TaxID=1872709 RepID=UPI000E3E6507|nr:anchored repeat-type ABC transporter ATP-binding subunit [Allorhizocola rhizosphaerae]
MIDAQGVRVELAGRTVLEDVRLVVAPGELVGLIGPNGAGKTTLLRAVLGLLPVSAGRITVGGRGPRQAMGTVGYVPQRHEFAWDYPISVEKAVRSALAHRRFTASHRAVAEEALSQVDMLALRGRPIGELSGGQRQRVLVARALALRPRVLLLDEPFTGLDTPTQQALTDLLTKLRREDVAVLMTTHDLPAARQVCTRLCLLNRTVIADGPPDELTDPQVWLKAFGVPI